MVTRSQVLAVATVLAMLHAATSGFAQAWAAAPEVAADVVTQDRYPAATVGFPGGVRGLPRLTFWKPASYRPLSLDLYLPPEAAERPTTGFPVVVFVHGGGWLGGDPRRSGPFVDFPGVLASIAARGYVVASIETVLAARPPSRRRPRSPGRPRLSRPRGSGPS